MINLKSKKEIDSIERSCRVVAEVLRRLERKIHPGVSTKELDTIAEQWIREMHAEPAFKNYRGYPATLCVSINEEVVHGIPSPRQLKEGDIVSIDVGARQNGYYGDAAFTFPVGEVAPHALRVIKVTRESLYRGIEQARAGNHLSDISWAIQSWVERFGLSVVRDFVGHGIGKELHEPPQIPNYVTQGKGVRLEVGMVFALEPMINAGTHRVKILDDGWTAITEDNSLSAHFEHTVAIMENGPRILTQWE
ncbi:MAG: type I methionyl aminopeptidase [Deltaproteobacteria bacterium]|nr:type I methionyl aminopeptidase [Deltaproteobacteria bacterium]MBW2305902.1 type I methionyl aminopeptidase [Deltaproteobacteria bacterium]